MLNVCSPTWLTQPPMTWPTRSGSIAGALDGGALHCRQQIDGMHFRETAVAATER